MGVQQESQVRSNQAQSVQESRGSVWNPFLKRARESYVVPPPQLPQAPAPVAQLPQMHAAQQLINSPFVQKRSGFPERNNAQHAVDPDFLDIEVMVDSLRDSVGPAVQQKDRFVYETPRIGIQSNMHKMQQQTVRNTQQTKPAQNQDLSFTQLRAAPKQKPVPSVAVLSQMINQVHQDLTQEHCDRLATFVLQEQRSDKRKKMAQALGLSECGF